MAVLSSHRLMLLADLGDPRPYRLPLRRILFQG